ncbi:type I restriction enzyme R family protein, partial [Bacteroides fragilis str. 20793-3]
MPLYKNTSAQLVSIKEKPFKLEREIQKIFENNLFTIMGIELVKSELTIKNKRIDSLGFDPQTKAFVIIEYKRERNSSVVDQGFTYLSLMLQNKADFILEYNENNQNILKRNDVDWSQSRVVFVSPSFTDNQKEAV